MPNKIRILSTIVLGVSLFFLYNLSVQADEIGFSSPTLASRETVCLKTVEDYSNKVIAAQTAELVPDNQQTLDAEKLFNMINEPISKLTLAC